MQITYISNDQTLQELTKTEDADFPLEIYLDEISLEKNCNLPWQRGIIPWHWHTELEFGCVTCGEVELCVADDSFVLREGEGVFINSNLLHCIKPLSGGDPSLFTVAVSPKLLQSSGFDLLSTKYVLPYIAERGVKYLTLSPEVSWQAQALSSLMHINAMHEAHPFGFEFDIRNTLCGIWLLLLQNVFHACKPGVRSSSDDEARIKQALAYIHRHYAEDISLGDISRAINLSKSECCRCFQRMLKSAPVDYLISYRVEKAASLLLSTKLPVSVVATQTGFNGLSYFGKIFKQRTGLTPREYRRSAQ